MLSPKDPRETITVSFDYEPHGFVPVNPTVTVSVSGGTADSNPSAILSSQPQVSGYLVLVLVTGGVDGCVYELDCIADGPNGERILITGFLPVTTQKQQ